MSEDNFMHGNIEKILSGKSPGSNQAHFFNLDSSASTIDNIYVPSTILIISGTGAGQARQFWQYDGTLRRGYVNRDWEVVPDSTSKYALLYNCGDTHVNEGMAQAGGAATITLNSDASNQNSVYLGQIIYIAAGKGAHQARMCIGYNGTTKVATVDQNWIIQPDNTSVYAMLPFPGFVHGITTQNSTRNVLLKDSIGNKTDYVTIPYSSGVNSLAAHANTMYQHAHGESLLYPKFANGVILTTAGTAYTDPGLPIEIIPANTLTSPFDIHFAFLYNLSAGGEFVVELYSGLAGAEVLLEDGLFAYRDTSGRVQLGNQRGQIPQQPANTRISAKAYFSGNSVQTLQIRLKGHYYA